MLMGRCPSSRPRRPASPRPPRRLQPQSPPPTSAHGTYLGCTRASCVRLPCRCAAQAVLPRCSVKLLCRRLFDNMSAQKPACLEVQLMHALDSTSDGRVRASALSKQAGPVSTAFATLLVFDHPVLLCKRCTCDQLCHQTADLVRRWAGCKDHNVCRERWLHAHMSQTDCTAAAASGSSPLPTAAVHAAGLCGADAHPGGVPDARHPRPPRHNRRRADGEDLASALHEACSSSRRSESNAGQHCRRAACTRVLP